MNKKIILTCVLILFLLFAGCTQKLSEKQLEEKAKQNFYSLEAVDIFGISFNASDFVLKNTEFIYTKDLDLYAFDCDTVLSGSCTLTENEFYALNEKVYVYDFQLKEEAKRDDRTVWGKVILKSDGTLIANYINGVEHAIE